jgi:hypothetical protein
MHGVALTADSGAALDVVAAEADTLRGHDAGERARRGRVQAHRLGDDLLQVAQLACVSLGKVVGQRGDLGDEAGANVWAAAHGPGEVRQRVAGRVGAGDNVRLRIDRHLLLGQRVVVLCLEDFGEERVLGLRPRGRRLFAAQ